jgi:hypothetical protein
VDSSTNQLDELERCVHHHLALLEIDFPVSLMLYIFHNAPPCAYIRKYGPVHNYWMFGPERIHHTMIDAISGRVLTELSIIRKYALRFVCQLMQFAENGYKDSTACEDIELCGGRPQSEEHTLPRTEYKALLQFYMDTRPALSAAFFRPQRAATEKSVKHTCR